MKYYATWKSQVHYVGKTEHSVTVKNYHVGFIVLRMSVWYMTNMIEQIGLALHISFTNVATLRMYKDISFVIAFISILLSLIGTAFTDYAFKILK
jgi:hypothetical protein